MLRQVAFIKLQTIVLFLRKQTRSRNSQDQLCESSSSANPLDEALTLSRRRSVEPRDVTHVALRVAASDANTFLTSDWDMPNCRAICDGLIPALVAARTALTCPRVNELRGFGLPFVSR
jgi:hypothetical protein